MAQALYAFAILWQEQYLHLMKSLLESLWRILVLHSLCSSLSEGKEGTGVIELQHISAGYGRQTVLNDVSVIFEKGKLTSIIGVNGCGKSTL